MSVITEFINNRPHKAEFDPLGRSLVRFLSILLPGSEIILRYLYSKTDPPVDPAELAPQASENMRLFWAGSEPLSGAPGWWRGIFVMYPTKSAPYFDQKLTELIEYALSIGTNIEHIWSLSISDAKLVEIKTALAEVLPRWIIAHLLAEQVYTFKDKEDAAHPQHDAFTKTLIETLGYLEELASIRVEHEELSHGVIITPQLADRGHSICKYPDDFLRLKRSALLNDGKTAVTHIDHHGNVLGMLTLEQLKMQRTHQPEPGVTLVSHLSEKLGGIGLQLQENKSITVYFAGTPILVRRNGAWTGLLWRSVQSAFEQRLGPIGKKIFQVATAVSTQEKGGILAIVNQRPKGIHRKDRVDLARRGKSPKIAHPEWIFHRMLPSDDITNLSVETLATLAGIDGATIVSAEGKLLAYGAVVKSWSAEAEGARTAAAKVLSNQGIVLKISADGPITLFENGDELFEM